MSTSRSTLIGLALSLATPLLFVAPAAHAAAAGCEDGSRSDFNGDGFTDTAISDPAATVAGQAEAGRVIVLYGDRDGRIGEGTRAVVRQGSGSVTGNPEVQDRFGFAVTVADLDCDSYTDLVVGTPYEDMVGLLDAGWVQIIWGAAGGLGKGRSSLQIDQTSFGESRHAGDQFGFAVDALEDVGQGDTREPDAYALGIGAPGWNVGIASDAGWVGFLHAADGDSQAVGVTQDSPDVPGAAEAGDRFGASVSVNYLVGNAGTVDAAVGAPNEDVGSVGDAGSVTLLRDIYDVVDGGVGYDQGSPGVPGIVEQGDQFGRSLDTVKAGATSRLAIGIPGEDIGSVSNAGAVQLFTSNGKTTAIGAALSQDKPGVFDHAEAGDLFGDRLAFAPPGHGDTVTRLAVSAPFEDGAAVDSGVVQVFPLTDLDAEVTYAQNSRGIPGAVDAGDRFGRELAVVTGVSERALIVGVPDDVDNATGMVNVIPLGTGAPRYWEPGTSRVPRAGASRFGSQLAGSAG